MVITLQPSRLDGDKGGTIILSPLHTSVSPGGMLGWLTQANV